MNSRHFLLILATGLQCEGRGVPLDNWKRITEGYDWDIEKAPWQVSVHAAGTHYCGASIYSESIVITAAFCFVYWNSTSTGLTYHYYYNEDYLISAGTEYKYSEENLAAVSGKWHHPDFKFNDPQVLNNIGIMKLRTPLQFSSKIKAIPLATEDPGAGSVALATGWGQTNIGGFSTQSDSPENLQGVYLVIESENHCKKSFPWIKKDHICAGIRGSCHRDNGGPLVVENTLVGVDSTFQKENCNGPRAYSSVAYHREWLLDTIKSHQRLPSDSLEIVGPRWGLRHPRGRKKLYKRPTIFYREYRLK